MSSKAGVHPALFQDEYSDIADLFLNTGTSAYPYREPRISPSLYQIDAPALQLHVPHSPAHYKPRGGVTESDWRVWDPRKLLPAIVDEYIEFGQSLCSAFSQEYLLTLLRDCDYDVTKAKSLLTEPVLNETRANPDVPHVLPGDKIWFKKPLNRDHIVGTPWSYVDIDRAEHVPHSVQAAQLESFVDKKRAHDQGELDARREELHRIFDIGCDLAHFKPAQSNHNNSFAIEQDQPNDGDQSPSIRMFSTPTPTESDEIDVTILRHVIQSLADTITDDEAATSSVLSQLQSYLDSFNAWLERVRPLLLAISKNKDSASLNALEELIRSIEYAAPCVTNVSKKKLGKCVAQARQWRDAYTTLYQKARLCGLSSDNTNPPQSWPVDSRIPFSQLSQIVREGEKACGSVFVDELAFYRESLEVCKKFQNAVEASIVKTSKPSRDDDSRSSGKLSVSQAEELLARVALYVPFVQMDEINTIESAIAASKSWVESVRDALASLDAHDETAVDKYRRLLDSSSTLALQQPMMETLKSQLELKLWFASVESTYGSAKQGDFKGPLLDRLRQLFNEGKVLKADQQHAVFKRLESHVTRGEALVARAKQSLRQRSTLEQFKSMVDEMGELPVSMPEEDKVNKIIHNTVEWHTTTQKLLAPILKSSINNSQLSLQPHQVHSISLDTVDAQIARSAGKNVAIISSDSMEMTFLRLLSKCGKYFTTEAKSCLNVLRVSGGGKDLLSSEYREKPIRREREFCLSQMKALLELYQSTPSPDQVNHSTFCALMREESSASESQSSESDGSQQSLNQSLDFSFLKKAKLEYADFVYGVALLDLPLVQKIQDKLDEVHECNEAGAKAANGEEGSLTLSDLSDLIFHLRRVGVSEDSEPLLTLTRRHDTGVVWQRTLMTVLPVGSIPHEAVRKSRPKKRVFRKQTRAVIDKSPSPPTPTPVDEDEAQDELMPQTNEQTADITNPLNTTAEQMSDEEETEPIADSSCSSDEYEYVPVVAPHPPARFRELTKLIDEYYSHTLDGAPDHPSYPTESNARLDLVQMPEMEYLIQSIDACRAWQAEASRAREQLDAGQLDAESLRATIERGRSLGTIMPELAELEVAAWSQQWRSQVAAQLNGTLELSAGIDLLRQLKSRFPALYHPLYSVQSQMEQEQKRTDTFLAEMDEQDAKDTEREQVSDLVVISDMTNTTEADVTVPEPCADATMATEPATPVLAPMNDLLDVSVLSKLQTEEHESECIDDTPSVAVDAQLSHVSRSDSNAINATEALFLQSVMADVRALESRVLGEYTWLKRVYSVFHRRFGSMASFLTRVTLGVEPPSLRMLIEDSDVSIEQLAGTQTPATKPKKRRGGRQSAASISAANQAVTDAVTTIAADAIDESQVDFSLIYCYCKRPALENEPMVACDQCKQWFHHHCLNLTKEDQKRLDSPRATFMCPGCAKTTGVPYQYREKAPNMKKRINGVRQVVVQRLIQTAPELSSSEQRRRLVGMFNRGKEWTARCKELLDSVELRDADTSSLAQQLEAQVKIEFDKWQLIRNRICEKRRQVLEKRIEVVTSRKQKPGSKASKATNARVKRESIKSESVKQEVIEPSVKSEVLEHPRLSDSTVLLQVLIRPCAPGSHDMVTVHIVLADPVTESVDPVLDGEIRVKVEKVEKTPRKSGRGGKRRSSIHDEPALVDDDTDVEMYDHEYQQMLQAELEARQQVLQKRALYADELQAVLRTGMSLPLEFDERFEVERRARLVLALERAERIMLDNSFSLKAQASLSLLFGKTNSDEDASHTVDEGVKVSLEKATRKNELKVMSDLHTLLVKCQATSYFESDMNQNLTIHRFNEWYAALIELNQSLIKQLTITSTVDSPALPFNQFFDCQTTFKLRFALLSLPSFVQTNMRVAAIVRWLPKERRGIYKKLRATVLNDLLSDRFKEVGNIHTGYTEIIVSKLAQIDQWNQRVEAAIQGKQGPQAFQALLTEVESGGLLVDESDIDIAKQYSQLYCLCQKSYEDGIFMIACDHCDDWFHPDCVNLKGITVKKIKTFQCPRCCIAQKLAYQYGSVEQFNIVPPAPSEPEQSPVKSDITVKKNKAEREREKAERKARKEQKAQLKLEKAAAKAAKALKQAGDASAIPSDTSNGQPSTSPVKVKRSKKNKDKDKDKDGNTLPSPDGVVAVDGASVDEVKKKKKRKHRDENGNADGKSDGESSKRRKKKHQSDDGSGESKSRKRSSKHSSSSSSSTSSAQATVPPKPVTDQPVSQPTSVSSPTIPQTAELYASLLYEQFSPLVTPDNATILWHLLSDYTARPFNPLLMAEINEAIRIVVSEQLFTQILPIFMHRYNEASNAAIEKAKAAVAKASSATSSGPPSPTVSERDSSRVKSKKKKRDKRHRESSDSIAVSSEDERAPSKKKKKSGRSSSSSSRIWPSSSHRRSPTPARTAFDFFVVFVHTHRRAELAMLQAHAGEEAQTQKGVTKLLQSQWKRLTTEEKSPFETEARLDRERYAREQQAYQVSLSTGSSGSLLATPTPIVPNMSNKPGPRPPDASPKMPPSLTSIQSLSSTSPPSVPRINGGGYHSYTQSSQDSSRPQSSTHNSSYSYNPSYHHHSHSHSIPMASAIYPSHQQIMMHHHPHLMNVPLMPMIMPNSGGQGPSHIVYVMPQQAMQQQQMLQQQSQQSTSNSESKNTPVNDATKDNKDNKSDAIMSPKPPMNTSMNLSKRAESGDDEKSSVSSLSSILSSPLPPLQDSHPHLTLHPQFSGSQISPLLTTAGSGQSVNNYIILHSPHKQATRQLVVSTKNSENTVIDDDVQLVETKPAGAASELKTTQL